MSERAPYSRVYWTIVDDPKFADVFDDDHALAAWLRLLIAADMAWPASAQIPMTVRKPALERLVSAGLVDLGTGWRFRIHGLDSERGERRAAATRLRTGRDPSGTQLGPNRDPDAADIPGRRRDEPRRDETSITPPPSKGRRDNGTNPRAAATNPRAKGTSPRQERDREKRSDMPQTVHDILRRAAAKGGES